MIQSKQSSQQLLDSIRSHLQFILMTLISLILMRKIISQLLAAYIATWSLIKVSQQKIKMVATMWQVVRGSSTLSSLSKPFGQWAFARLSMPLELFRALMRTVRTWTLKLKTLHRERVRGKLGHQYLHNKISALILSCSWASFLQELFPLLTRVSERDNKFVLILPNLINATAILIQIIKGKTITLGWQLHRKLDNKYLHSNNNCRDQGAHSAQVKKILTHRFSQLMKKRTLSEIKRSEFRSSDSKTYWWKMAW